MSNRLDASIEAMANRYPNFTYSEGLVEGIRQGRWVGKVQPIASPEIPWKLLGDLHHNTPVIANYLHLDHWEGCGRDHNLDELPSLILSASDLHLEFELEVIYNGTAALPLCRPRNHNLRRVNHMWSNGAMCAFIASDWQWRSETVADCMPHHYVWLVKAMVYNANENNVWIGPEHINDPKYHLTILSPKDPCWCGTGRQYRRCCRDREILALHQQRTQTQSLLRRWF